MFFFLSKTRSIITKQVFLAASCHWWIMDGQDSHRTQRWGVIASNLQQYRFFFGPHVSVCCSTVVVEGKSNRMSDLKEICSGLPLDPLPSNPGRDPGVPHAPIRTPNLTAQEERVSKYTTESQWEYFLKASTQPIIYDYLNDNSPIKSNYFISICLITLPVVQHNH